MGDEAFESRITGGGGGGSGGFNGCTDEIAQDIEFGHLVVDTATGRWGFWVVSPENYKNPFLFIV